MLGLAGGLALERGDVRGLAGGLARERGDVPGLAGGSIALERGDAIQMPPVLYLQGTQDYNHPRADLDRFVAGYRKAGGSLELHLYDGEKQLFIPQRPDVPASIDALAKIVGFVQRTLA